MNKLICKHCAQNQFIKLAKSKRKQRYQYKQTFTKGDVQFGSNE